MLNNYNSIRIDSCEANKTHFQRNATQSDMPSLFPEEEWLYSIE